MKGEKDRGRIGSVEASALPIAGRVLVQVLQNGF